jgi:hypothetical protein
MSAPPRLFVYLFRGHYTRFSERPHTAKVGIFVYTKFDRFVNILSA